MKNSVELRSAILKELTSFAEILKELTSFAELLNDLTNYVETNYVEQEITETEPKVIICISTKRYTANCRTVVKVNTLKAIHYLIKKAI